MARNIEVDPSQEPLIDVAFIPSGMTDAENYEPKVVLNIADTALPGFEQPQVLEPVEVIDAIGSVVSEGNTSWRRNAQLGRHSPLRHRGQYVDVQPGDVLPTFGVVTYQNFNDAHTHAIQLDMHRRSRNARSKRAST